MQPAKLSIPELFHQREQYLIPLFQRGYVWTLTNQIQPLWEDIVDRVDALKEHRENGQKIGGTEKLRPLRKHFLGAIVVGSPVGFANDVIATREVIDGQQRTTTLQIMLLALRDVLAPLGDEALDDDLKTLTMNRGTYKTKSDHLKVLPTNVGRDVMRTLFEARSCSEVASRFPVRGPNREVIERPLLVQSYLFFYAMLSCMIRGKRFDDPLIEGDATEAGKTIAASVIRSIAKDNKIQVPFLGSPIDLQHARLLMDALQTCFQVMRLQLDEEDDPQIIFETLNARGAPLTPSDLIRNYVFLRASRAREPVDELYDMYWREFDEKAENIDAGKGTKFWKKEERQGRLKSTRLDLLLYHYMSLRRQMTIKVSHVFEEFKDWWEAEGNRDTARELELLHKISLYFETISAPGQNSRFSLFCRRMKLLDTSTHTPLLFHLLEHKSPSDADFLNAVADLESYFVRRFVCGLTTKSYNRIFGERLLSEMVSEGATEASILRSKLLALDGPSQRWPRDEEFESAWLHRQLYEGSNTRRVRAVLEGLELALRTRNQEFVPELSELTVEHVLPQKWNVPNYPLPNDNPEARAARWRLMHSIGNLTLVTGGFNSALSNEAFCRKRPEIAANSSLMLNAYFQRLRDEDAWDETAILARAGELFSIALRAWPFPSDQAFSEKGGYIGAGCDETATAPPQPAA
jgi:hypothetical protein